MKQDLRILLLEDSPHDVGLIELELEAARLSFHLVQVQTEGELRSELAVALPDLVLSDHGLPSFDGFTALEIVRQQSPELPFIFISGSNDQGMVANMYDLGATDYVYKKDLHDLRWAVRRALEPEPESPPDRLEPEVREDITSLALPASAFTRLHFCPECLQAWDASDALIQLADCFRRHTEVLVVRQRCVKCGRMASAI